MAQFLRPIADNSVGNWTASTGFVLYSTLDETSPSDADYIKNTALNNVCNFQLTSVSAPTAGTRTFRVRAWNNSLRNDANLFISLKQGTTLLQQWSITNVSTNGYVTYTQTITVAITDYTDLKFELYFTAIDIGPEMRVSWVEFEIPDASPPPVTTKYYLIT